jgi:HEAT repeat protein/beta-lactamase regulating signal transducer with metallopeptidase domain
MTFTDFDPMLLDSLVKATLLLGAAAVLTLALARASAAVRHLVWTFALTGALLLPVLSLALPRWQVPLVTFTTPAMETSIVPEEATLPTTPPVRRARVEVRSNVAEVSDRAALPPAAPSAQPLPWSAASVLLAIWAGGAAIVIGRLLLGIAAVQWMTRRTGRVVDAPWLRLAVALASDLGITRRVTFLESRRATMPMAFGILEPAVLMPADAARWPIERLRIVLLHELAHVKRRDCLTHAIAQVACAVYWFNPLAWIAARHIRTERERACDDLVLAAGTNGPDYAEELLEIARVMRAGRFPALMTGATLAMAHRTQLEGRLIAILDPKVPRAGVSRIRTAVAATTVACALPPLAALQPWTVVEAAPAAISAFESVAESTPAPEVPQVATPTPRPAPSPAPSPSPSADVSDGEIARALATVVVDSAQAAVQSVAQAAVQGAAQGAVQGAAQGSVQGVVQEAIQGAIQSATAFVEQEGAAKRPGADPRMVAALTAALKDSDKDVRETAMHALIQLRDPSIFEPLVQALKDSSPDVREQAARGLGQLRDKRAVDPLMGALKDENASVREQAVFALGQLRDPRAVDPLIAALKDSSADVREQAAFALGQLRDKRAVPALNAVVKDANGDVREQVVFALGQIRDVAAVEGLMAALRDEKPDVRQQAAFALGQIREARAVEPLISALKDSHADVRQQAAFSLGQLRDRSAVEALIVAIKDTSADVREQVVFALGQIRDPRAIDALTNALKDVSADVRQQAAFALGQLAR